MKIKTICFFGIYDPGYSRNRVLMRGFKENGVAIIECNSRTPGVKKYLELIRKFLKIKKENNLDAVFVAFPGQEIMFLARLLTRKPIIFDAFTSHYEGYILDRTKYSKNSFRAKYYKFLDRYSCKLANLCLLDTEAHIDFFVNEFKLPRNKFLRVFVGTDNNTFSPDRKEKNNEKLLIHFHGHFIPLQGAEYIIRAAHILKNEDANFQIIGRGQEYLKVRNLAEKLGLKNINWISNVPYEKLPGYINRADICLGIFGDNQKARAVIPNKAFEAVACAKPLITADTLAISEAFEHGKNCWLVPAGDPKALAEAIVYLRDNHDMREKIASGGYKLFRTRMLPNILTQQLIDLIKK